MQVHFIAIGGSAMHSLALALQRKGYTVTGSDDEIFEPSRSRLQRAGLLPERWGWFPEKIHKNLDAVILGMHAREDNPELRRARELALKIYSYPEYLYEQTKDKIRVVVGGSHGKTTITSMIIHVLTQCGKDFDYMVGAQLEGFDNMVRLSDTAPLAVFEGDEYLASPLDPRPKFHIYQPNIAVLSGIAWDHINVFTSFDVYVEQFKIFIETIEPNGTLVYCADDPLVAGIALIARKDVTAIPYHTHPYRVIEDEVYLESEGKLYPVLIFGRHNMQNIAAAKAVCRVLGIGDEEFYSAIASFKGAARRLQLIANNEYTNVYFDFAHAPSKLTASVKAVKEHFPDRKLVACMELHTFSSLSENFLQQYYGTMEKADLAFVYYNPKVLEAKQLKPITPEMVRKAFGSKHLTVYTQTDELVDALRQITWKGTNLLLMSSGNFDGLDITALANSLVHV
ncbi:MAG TPA: Mur ligase family protein [Bacteroidales bacterium]|nr:Mur ligase family protein [Bacteroidales bacterium]HPO65929.1 Mur ligase family protein [Bacteroidales bacterium]